MVLLSSLLKGGDQFASLKEDSRIYPIGLEFLFEFRYPHLMRRHGVEPKRRRRATTTTACQGWCRRRQECLRIPHKHWDCQNTLISHLYRILSLLFRGFSDLPFDEELATIKELFCDGRKERKGWRRSLIFDVSMTWSAQNLLDLLTCIRVIELTDVVEIYKWK